MQAVVGHSPAPPSNPMNHFPSYRRDLKPFDVPTIETLFSSTSVWIRREQQYSTNPPLLRAWTIVLLRCSISERIFRQTPSSQRLRHRLPTETPSFHSTSQHAHMHLPTWMLIAQPTFSWRSQTCTFTVLD